MKVHTVLFAALVAIAYTSGELATEDVTPEMAFVEATSSLMGKQANFERAPSVPNPMKSPEDLYTQETELFESLAQIDTEALKKAPKTSMHPDDVLAESFGYKKPNWAKGRYVPQWVKKEDVDNIEEVHKKLTKSHRHVLELVEELKRKPLEEFNTELPEAFKKVTPEFVKNAAKADTPGLGAEFVQAVASADVKANAGWGGRRRRRYNRRRRSCNWICQGERKLKAKARQAANWAKEKASKVERGVKEKAKKAWRFAKEKATKVKAAAIRAAKALAEKIASAARLAKLLVDMVKQAIGTVKCVIQAGLKKAGGAVMDIKKMLSKPSSIVSSFTKKMEGNIKKMLKMTQMSVGASLRLMGSITSGTKVDPQAIINGLLKDLTKMGRLDPAIGCLIPAIKSGLKKITSGHTLKMKKKSAAQMLPFSKAKVGKSRFKKEEEFVEEDQDVKAKKFPNVPKMIENWLHKRLWQGSIVPTLAKLGGKTIKKSIRKIAPNLGLKGSVFKKMRREFLAQEFDAEDVVLTQERAELAVEMTAETKEEAVTAEKESARFKSLTPEVQTVFLAALTTNLSKIAVQHDHKQLDTLIATAVEVSWKSLCGKYSTGGSWCKVASRRTLRKAFRKAKVGQYYGAEKVRRGRRFSRRRSRYARCIRGRYARCRRSYASRRRRRAAVLVQTAAKAKDTTQTGWARRRRTRRRRYNYRRRRTRRRRHNYRRRRTRRNYRRRRTARRRSIRHYGKDCWRGCKRKQGKCSWCGSGGICCRYGWGNKSRGCTGKIGIKGKGHVCVAAPRRARRTIRRRRRFIRRRSSRRRRFIRRRSSRRRRFRRRRSALGRCYVRARRTCRRYLRRFSRRRSRRFGYRRRRFTRRRRRGRRDRKQKGWGLGRYAARVKEAQAKKWAKIRRGAKRDKAKAERVVKHAARKVKAYLARQRAARKAFRIKFSLWAKTKTKRAWKALQFQRARLLSFRLKKPRFPRWLTIKLKKSNAAFRKGWGGLTKGFGGYLRKVKAAQKARWAKIGRSVKRTKAGMERLVKSASRKVKAWQARQAAARRAWKLKWKMWKLKLHGWKKKKDARNKERMAKAWKQLQLSKRRLLAFRFKKPQFPRWLTHKLPNALRRGVNGLGKFGRRVGRGFKKWGRGVRKWGRGAGRKLNKWAKGVGKGARKFGKAFKGFFVRRRRVVHRRRRAPINLKISFKKFKAAWRRRAPNSRRRFSLFGRRRRTMRCGGRVEMSTKMSTMWNKFKKEDNKVTFSSVVNGGIALLPIVKDVRSAVTWAWSHLNKKGHVAKALDYFSKHQNQKGLKRLQMITMGGGLKKSPFSSVAKAAMSSMKKVMVPAITAVIRIFVQNGYDFILDTATAAFMRIVTFLIEEVMPIPLGWESGGTVIFEAIGTVPSEIVKALWTLLKQAGRMMLVEVVDFVASNVVRGIMSVGQFGVGVGAKILDKVIGKYMVGLGPKIQRWMGSLQNFWRSIPKFFTFAISFFAKQFFNMIVKTVAPDIKTQLSLMGTLVKRALKACNANTGGKCKAMPKPKLKKQAGWWKHSFGKKASEEEMDMDLMQMEVDATHAQLAEMDNMSIQDIEDRLMAEGMKPTHHEEEAITFEQYVRAKDPHAVPGWVNMVLAEDHAENDARGIVNPGEDKTLVELLQLHKEDLAKHAEHQTGSKPFTPSHAGRLDMLLEEDLPEHFERLDEALKGMKNSKHQAKILSRAHVSFMETRAKLKENMHFGGLLAFFNRRKNDVICMLKTAKQSAGKLVKKVMKAGGLSAVGVFIDATLGKLFRGTKALIMQTIENLKSMDKTIAKSDKLITAATFTRMVNGAFSKFIKVDPIFKCMKPVVMEAMKTVQPIADKLIKGVNGIFLKYIMGVGNPIVSFIMKNAINTMGRLLIGDKFDMGLMQVNQAVVSLQSARDVKINRYLRMIDSGMPGAQKEEAKRAVTDILSGKCTGVLEDIIPIGFRVVQFLATEFIAKAVQRVVPFAWDMVLDYVSVILLPAITFYGNELFSVGTWATEWISAGPMNMAQFVFNFIQTAGKNAITFFVPKVIHQVMNLVLNGMFKFAVKPMAAPKGPALFIDGLMKKIGAFILKGVKAIVKLFPKGLVRIVQTNIEGLVKSFLKVVAPGALDQAKLNKAMMKVVRWKEPKEVVDDLMAIDEVKDNDL